VACLSAVTNCLVPQDARYFLQELRTSLHQEAFCSMELEKHCIVLVQDGVWRLAGCKDTVRKEIIVLCE
jgi:hypothetical protein